MNHPRGFLFVTCQIGAELALKAELARRWPDFRFAYSRPGFLTFKLPTEQTLADDFDLHSIFARSHGFSIGKATGDDLTERARQVVDLARGLNVDRLHVWQRDTAAPGQHGFEPGETPAAAEARAAILAAWPGDAATSATALVEPTAAGHHVLDCIVVEPDQWWIGFHRASAMPSRWPGGLPPVRPADDMVSRAYVKIEEALLWSRMPVQPGDPCVEIGSAPGGSSQALLARGLRVLGVDPADMDERVAKHPHYTHLKMRGADVQRREFREMRWLMADVNLAPAYTLDTVEAIVTHPQVHVLGMLLTLKLLEWSLVEELPGYLERIRSWGFADVRARQLAFNRQEICVAALRQRDLRKRPPRQQSVDKSATARVNPPTKSAGSKPQMSPIYADNESYGASVAKVPE